MESQNTKKIQTHRTRYVFRAHIPEMHCEADETELVRAMAHLGMFARLAADAIT